MYFGSCFLFCCCFGAWSGFQDTNFKVCVKETGKTHGTGTVCPEIPSSLCFIDPDFRKSAASLLLFVLFV